MLSRYRLLGDMAVAALVVWLLVGIVMSVVGQVVYKYPEAGAAPLAVVQRAPLRLEDYALINERDLMHLAAKPLTGGLLGENSAVDAAQLGVKLVGTIAGPVFFARAIIDEGGNQVLYKIGERIKGAEIVAIYRNKIILNVGGREQMLAVDLDASTAEDKPAAAEDQSPAAKFGPNLADRNSSPSFGQGRISPFYKSGKPYGFRVSGVVPGSSIYGLGVRSGDILRSVNGQSVSTSEDLRRVSAQYKGAARVSVELERHGAPQTIDVPLAEILKGSN